jgi:hypothetical protein
MFRNIPTKGEHMNRFIIIAVLALSACAGPMDEGPLAEQAGRYPAVSQGRPGETYTTPLVVETPESNLDQTPPLYRGTYCWNRSENRYYRTAQTACVGGDPVITEEQFNALHPIDPDVDQR